MTAEDKDETQPTASVPEEAAPEPSRLELAAQIADIEQSLQTISNLVSSISARLLRNVDELKGEIRERATREDIEATRKDLERLRARIDDVVDEVGYGEAIDIAKVPPTILEAAYQAILDDILAELHKVRGQHDTEVHIVQSFEQLRMKTSGSELFHFRHGRIQVGIARPMERGLVSARQVQMTFEELMRHLREPVHSYAPKNFRALIKVKSQEYAVAGAGALARRVEESAAATEELRARVVRLEEQVTGALRDLHEFARRLEPTLTGAATRESVEAVALRVEAIERARSAPPPAPAVDVEARVLEAIREQPRTLAALKKALDLDDATLEAALTELERRSLISSSVKGRSSTYRIKEEREDA